MNEVLEISREDLGFGIVFGLPGTRAWIAAEVLQSIIHIALRECEVVEINSLQDWNEACATGQHFVAVSQYPSPELFSHVERTGIPALVISDSPVQSVAKLAGDLQSNIGAVRTVSSSLSCLAAILGRGELEIQESNQRSLSAFLMLLVKMRGVDVSPRLKLELSRLGNAYLYQAETVPLVPDLSDLVQAVLPESNKDWVHWPSSLFLLGDFPDTPMLGPVDLAGPARCLLYGPYMHLPSGRWKACIAVGIGGNDALQSFTVEIVCNEIVASGHFYCQGSGSFEVGITFLHDNPHVPIELRLFSDVGAIYGSLSQFEVRWTPAD